MDKAAKDYQSRLDRMVAALASGHLAVNTDHYLGPEDRSSHCSAIIETAQDLLAAIDEAVREKQDDEQG